MPAITFDAQSLILDGRREWFVGATLPYACHPRDEWPARIADAADAGFNCLLIPCVWAAHEPRKGAWDFTGDRDVRALLLLIRKAGLRAMLRLGPFVGPPWDMGGIPPWVGSSATRSHALATREGLVAASQAHWAGLRAGTPEFLEATSRWYAALAEQVRDQQATVSAAAPIVAAQTEHEWLCADPIVAEGYLAELGRFARESGFTVPLLNANNLHAGAEGDIDAWSGGGSPLATARQLGAVRNTQPPILLELGGSALRAWGAPPDATDPVELQAALAQALAGGAQPAIARFAPGALFGFDGGRSGDSAHTWFCPSPDDAVALVADGGARTDAFRLVKRLATFASSFGRVLANREIARTGSMLAPPDRSPDRSLDRAAAATNGGGVSALAHLPGARGVVDFLFTSAPGQTRAVLASDGSAHAVHTGEQRIAWRVERIHLNGRSTLDHCDACAFALVGRAFAVFGPAGKRASLSINGGAFEVEFPSGPLPTIEEHDDAVLVVCNEAQIDAAVATEDEIHVGVLGLTPSREPIHHPDFRARLRIGADGAVERVNAPTRKPAPAQRAPAIGAWSLARCDEHVRGASDRYAAVPGPARLDALGAPSGYGWMRLRFTSASPRTVKIALPHCADRAHLYLDGEPVGIVGAGPGATGPGVTGHIVSLALKKREHTLTILLDNLGRAAGGSTMGEPKGLWGPPMEAAPLRLGAPTLIAEAPLAPLEFRSPLLGVRDADRTDPRRLTWTIHHRRKSDIAVCIDEFGAPALLLVNNKVVDFLDHADRPRIILGDDRLKQGKNTVALAFLTDHGGAGSAEDAAKVMRSGVRFLELVAPLAAKASWAFAKWETPGAKAFAPPARAGSVGAPAWWKARFASPARGENGAHASLFLDMAGLTKGQVFVNGRNLARYFVATPSGKRVPGQQRVRIPPAWLKHSGENDLLLFDEHGASPAKTRLSFA